MALYALLAEAFRYPSPGQLELLEALVPTVPEGKIREGLLDFLGEVRLLSLGEWEELYTRTWDLSPLLPPYIGFQIWGEDYRRGGFLARLQQAYRDTGVDVPEELPDHLVPVLRYLEVTHTPIPELVEVFHPALEKMTATLRKRDRSNPYLHLLEGMLYLELSKVKLENR